MVFEKWLSAYEQAGNTLDGYLTGLALARNSDIFKAGVDMHGVHDWSSLPDMPFAK